MLRLLFHVCMLIVARPMSFEHTFVWPPRESNPLQPANPVPMNEARSPVQTRVFMPEPDIFPMFDVAGRFADLQVPDSWFSTP